MRWRGSMLRSSASVSTARGRCSPPAARQASARRSIAARLGISVKTAGHHVSHIFEKLGVSNRAEAAVLAERMDLASGRAADS